MVLGLSTRASTRIRIEGIPLWIDLIPHAQNEEVDMIRRLTTEELGQLPQEVLVETISQLNFEKHALIMQLYTEPYWMDLFIKYLDQEELSEDKNEVRKIAAKAGNYLYEDGVLFKRGKFIPWL